MRAEVIGVGTELLLGEIPNSNAQAISAELADLGIDVLHHVAVGDNLGRVTEALTVALNRADIVIVTGGLGPTPDDLTRDAAAAALGVPLERDEEMVATLESIFQRLGRDMPDENKKQADFPAGAEVISPEGTAPGFVARAANDSILVCLPGVPWEMKAMMRKDVIPRLRSLSGEGTLVIREVLVVGLGESHTHHLISDLVEQQTDPTIAFLAGGGAVRVRLITKARDEAEGIARIEPLEAEIRRRLGPSALRGEGRTPAEILGQILVERSLTVAVAESLTGGMIASALTEAEGASDFFLGSIVAYATEAKRDVVGVDEEVLEREGPVSEEAAAQLAERAAAVFSADLGLAATGVAGPATQDGKPVGTLFVAAHHGGRTEVRSPRGYGDRGNIRRIAVTSALDLGRRLLSGDL